MERSEIRGPRYVQHPDSVLLHPGYLLRLHQSNVPRLQRAERVAILWPTSDSR